MEVEKKELSQYLRQFISETRMQRFHEVLEERTRHITVVLEDIYQEHNASAVLRSCDCFGLQDVHFIENRNKLMLAESELLQANYQLLFKQIVLGFYYP